jgi:hypothetical protein
VTRTATVASQPCKEELVVVIQGQYWYAVHAVTDSNERAARRHFAQLDGSNARCLDERGGDVADMVDGNGNNKVSQPSRHDRNRPKTVRFRRDSVLVDASRTIIITRPK